MKFVVTECVITFEASVRAEARIVWASFAVLDTSVSISTCRLSAAYNTVSLLALAQEMEVPIQSLRISVWM